MQYNIIMYNYVYMYICHPAEAWPPHRKVLNVLLMRTHLKLLCVITMKQYSCLNFGGRWNPRHNTGMQV